MEMTYVSNIIPGFLDMLCGVPVSGRCSLPYSFEKINICFISRIIRYMIFMRYTLIWNC